MRKPFSRDGGYTALTDLAPQLAELDVVAAMSDAMAVGAIVRSRELGMQLHDDIEITGFDHVPVIGDLLPSFTTVEIPFRRWAAWPSSSSPKRHSSRTSHCLPARCCADGPCRRSELRRFDRNRLRRSASRGLCVSAPAPLRTSTEPAPSDRVARRAGREIESAPQRRSHHASMCAWGLRAGCTGARVPNG